MNNLLTMQESQTELTAGITREWRYEHQLLIYTVRNVQREAVDALMNDAAEIFREHEGKLSVMFDVSPEVMMTPYYTSRLEEQRDFFRRYRGLLTVVMVTSAGLMNRLFITAGDMLVRTLGSARYTQRFFSRRDEALSWLDSQMAG